MFIELFTSYFNLRVCTPIHSFGDNGIGYTMKFSMDLGTCAVSQTSIQK